MTLISLVDGTRPTSRRRVHSVSLFTLRHASSLLMSSRVPIQLEKKKFKNFHDKLILHFIVLCLFVLGLSVLYDLRLISTSMHCITHPSSQTCFFFFLFLVLYRPRAESIGGAAEHEKNHKKVRRLGWNALMDVFFWRVVFFAYGP
jgi:hypothetical protein